ncbi:MAG: TetR/AcrR family transcriptional regulator [candidate division Zixibacteria bacterium]|nr:TetR/AcrR family transcriptional regulator [candidate division Zixibacteria bacterium]
MNEVINSNNNTLLTTDKDSSKGRIISAALDEFGQYGLAGARVDRIAKKSGLNKAMIYYHFHSKENLYREMIKSFFTYITGEIGQSLKTSGTAAEVLSSVIDVYTQLFLKDTPIRSILLRELANPKGEILKQIAGVLTESKVSIELRSLIEEGVDKGYLRSVDIRQAVVSFLAMNIGYFIISPITDRVLQIEDREKFIKERKEAVMDLFLNGMKAREK